MKSALQMYDLTEEELVSAANAGTLSAKRGNYMGHPYLKFLTHELAKFEQEKLKERDEAKEKALLEEHGAEKLAEMRAADERKAREEQETKELTSVLLKIAKTSSSKGMIPCSDKIAKTKGKTMLKLQEYDLHNLQEYPNGKRIEFQVKDLLKAAKKKHGMYKLQDIFASNMFCTEDAPCKDCLGELVLRVQKITKEFPKAFDAAQQEVMAKLQSKASELEEQALKAKLAAEAATNTLKCAEAWTAPSDITVPRNSDHDGTMKTLKLNQKKRKTSAGPSLKKPLAATSAVVTESSKPVRGRGRPKKATAVASGDEGPEEDEAPGRRSKRRRSAPKTYSEAASDGHGDSSQEEEYGGESDVSEN